MIMRSGRVKCCCNKCDKEAIATYVLGRSKFRYCKRHKAIPEKIISSLNRYKGMYGARWMQYEMRKEL